MLKIWKFQISLFGILFAAILIEVGIIPLVWAPVRIDFLIGMIIGQIIFVPFSQGFPFIILSSIILQAFSGARIGLIPLIYIAVFVIIDVLKNVIYLENIFTQALLGIFFYSLITSVTATVAGSRFLEDAVVPMVAGMGLTALLTPVMVSIVGRLQAAYDVYGS